MALKTVVVSATVNLVNVVTGTLGLQGTAQLTLNGPGGLLKYEYDVKGEDEESVYRKLDKLFSSIATKKRKVVQGKTENATSKPDQRGYWERVCVDGEDPDKIPGNYKIPKNPNPPSGLTYQEKEDIARKARSVLQRERK